ncbi:hypothetical protein BJP40_03735 [Streptomyces sp. CC53]|uniref:hypothetical protein n=1 Tax=Streptomyces sp. CC53 TaxID=1906740 RepID=UPI0008DE599D|nr:hypothetical protein [Streptomyces sp. CC53]OII62127.1 hypothetical protein BJP40_03735 [Streptomyces sp. CC53]
MPDRHPPSVTLDPCTHSLLNLLAKAWNSTPNDAVRQLLVLFAEAMPAAAQTDADGRVPVYAIYAATRIDALYDTTTQSVTIPEGNPGSGTYKSPSGASRAVIEALRPDVLPIRTGWAFWRITSSGQILRTIRPPSATALAARAVPPPTPQATSSARSR